jgi:hypothetical protein
MVIFSPVCGKHVGRLASNVGTNITFSQRDRQPVNSAAIQPISYRDPCLLAERILDRREKALRTGLFEAAERLLALGWEAYNRAQLPEGHAVTYVE